MKKAIKQFKYQKPWAQKYLTMNNIIMVLLSGITAIVAITLIVAIIYFLCILLITPHSVLL